MVTLDGTSETHLPQEADAGNAQAPTGQIGVPNEQASVEQLEDDAEQTLSNAAETGKEQVPAEEVDDVGSQTPPAEVDVASLHTLLEEVDNSNSQSIPQEIDRSNQQALHEEAEESDQQAPPQVLENGSEQTLAGPTEISNGRAPAEQTEAVDEQALAANTGTDVEQTVAEPTDKEQLPSSEPETRDQQTPPQVLEKGTDQTPAEPIAAGDEPTPAGQTETGNEQMSTHAVETGDEQVPPGEVETSDEQMPLAEAENGAQEATPDEAGTGTSEAIPERVNDSSLWASPQEASKSSGGAPADDAWEDVDSTQPRATSPTGESSKLQEPLLSNQDPSASSDLQAEAPSRLVRLYAKRVAAHQRHAERWSRAAANRLVTLQLAETNVRAIDARIQREGAPSRTWNLHRPYSPQREDYHVFDLYVQARALHASVQARELLERAKVARAQARLAAADKGRTRASPLGTGWRAEAEALHAQSLELYRAARREARVARYAIVLPPLDVSGPTQAYARALVRHKRRFHHYRIYRLRFAIASKLKSPRALATRQY